MSMAGKWGYSHDEEQYYGDFETREEAIEEARSVEAGYVGQYSDPTPPEEFIDAEDLLEKVLCQDEYSGGFAEDTLDCTREQRDELTVEIRRAFAAWMDRHDLRPNFGWIEHAESIGEILSDG